MSSLWRRNTRNKPVNTSMNTTADQSRSSKYVAYDDPADGLDFKINITDECFAYNNDNIDCCEYKRRYQFASNKYTRKSITIMRLVLIISFFCLQIQWHDILEFYHAGHSSLMNTLKAKRTNAPTENKNLWKLQKKRIL